MERKDKCKLKEGRMIVNKGSNETAIKQSNLGYKDVRRTWITKQMKVTNDQDEISNNLQFEPIYLIT